MTNLRHFVALLLLAIALLLSTRAAASEDFPAFTEGKFGIGTLHMDRGLPVMHVYGSPEEMGAQAGRLTKAQIKFLIEEYIYKLVDEDARKKLRPVIKGLEYKIPETLRRELKAMATAAEVPYDDLLLANCSIDLNGTLACSTLALSPSRSGTGDLIIGRNLEYMDWGVIEHADLITVYHPTDGRRDVVNIGWPGLIGVVTGMNEAGLSAAMLVSLSAPPQTGGVPSVLAFRDFLHRNTLVSEGPAYFNQIKLVLPCNLTLGDAKNESSVLELNPYTGMAVRKPEDGFLACTNVFASNTKHLSENDARYKSLVENAKSQKKHDITTLRTYMAAVAQNMNRIKNLQAMVIQPAKRTIHLSALSNPAADGKYLKIDVAKLTDVVMIDPVPQTASAPVTVPASSSMAGASASATP